MVMAVFPEQRADRYSTFKKVCYFETPVASQGIVAKTIRDDKKVLLIFQMFCSGESPCVV